MANRVILTGRLTADPELHQTQEGTPVTSISIAVPRKFKKDVTDFLNIVAWRKNAEFLCRYFSKGKWVEVDGSIQTRSYQDKDGNNRKAFEIVADEINFVGDRPKDEATPTANPPAPPIGAPAGLDPFAGAASYPVYSSAGQNNFSAPDDEGDLPF